MVAVAAQRLQSFIERLENIEDQRADLAIDLKAVYDEAKGEGFDAKVMRKIVARRKDPAKTAEQDELINLYESAIGGRRKDPRQTDIEDALAAKQAA